MVIVLFEGMPWPLVLPIALIAFIIAVINSKKEEKHFEREFNKLKHEKEIENSDDL